MSCFHNGTAVLNRAYKRVITRDLFKAKIVLHKFQVVCPKKNVGAVLKGDN